MYDKQISISYRFLVIFCFFINAQGEYLNTY